MAQLDGTLSRLHEISESEFRSLQYRLVSVYRLDVDAQEEIELALVRAIRCAVHPLLLHRIDETLAMLQHVHDPMISSGTDGGAPH